SNSIIGTSNSLTSVHSLKSLAILSCGRPINHKLLTMGNTRYLSSRTISCVTTSNKALCGYNRLYISKCGSTYGSGDCITQRWWNGGQGFVDGQICIYCCLCYSRSLAYGS